MLDRIVDWRCYRWYSIYQPIRRNQANAEISRDTEILPIRRFYHWYSRYHKIRRYYWYEDIKQIRRWYRSLCRNCYWRCLPYRRSEIVSETLTETLDCIVDRRQYRRCYRRCYRSGYRRYLHVLRNTVRCGWFASSLYTILVAFTTIPYDGNRSIQRWPYDGGRYDAVLVALAILYNGNRSIQRSPYDGNCSSCNIVQWKSVDTTFTVWWRSIRCRTSSSCNIVGRFCCSRTVQRRSFTILYLKRLQYQRLQ